MAEGEDQGWLDDETDPFEDPQASEAEVESIEAAEEVTESSEVENSDEVSKSESESDSEMATHVDPTPSAWGLPIRAAPVLEQNGELVTEYPLKQSLDGRQTTSMVVDDDLLRVVDTELGDDGHRRMKVRMTIHRDITAFSHQHNELMHQHQMLWIGCFTAGLVLALIGPNAFGVLGALLAIIGVRSWVLMHLESHTLEFSNQAGPHSLTLHAYGSNRGFFRASMAMIGPIMADFIRNGTMMVDELEQLHASVLAPPAPPAPVPAQAMPAVPIAPVMAPIHPEVSEAASPIQPEVAPPQLPTTIPAPPAIGPPASLPSPPQAPVRTAPPPPKNIPAPLPAAPPPPAPASLPLPPAPLPPPMPMPPAAIGLAPLPPPGMPMPLDAPLPDAPQIAVEASPVEETLTPDEQNELLSELS